MEITKGNLEKASQKKKQRKKKIQVGFATSRVLGRYITHARMVNLKKLMTASRMYREQQYNFCTHGLQKSLILGIMQLNIIFHRLKFDIIPKKKKKKALY